MRGGGERGRGAAVSIYLLLQLPVPLGRTHSRGRTQWWDASTALAQQPLPLLVWGLEIKAQSLLEPLPGTKLPPSPGQAGSPGWVCSGLFPTLVCVPAASPAPCRQPLACPQVGTELQSKTWICSRLCSLSQGGQTPCGTGLGAAGSFCRTFTESQNGLG